MRNLLQETERVLDKHGKTKDNIRWIGGDSFTISIEDFIHLADKEYNAGYGAQKVARDLKIVGDDWWMERAEYDGAEWWEFKEPPECPTTRCEKPISLYAKSVGWESLEEINFSKIH